MSHRTIRYNLLSVSILATLFFIINNMAAHLASPTRYTIDKTAAVYSAYAYRIDTTNNLTLDQFINEPQALIKQPFSTINWQLNTQDYWLQIKLDNKQHTDIDIFVHFDNPMLDSLTVYQLDDSGKLLKTFKLGDKEQDLSLFEYSVPHITATLAKQTSSQFVIKIATVGISKTPINIYGKNEFKDLLRSQTAIWGIFVGVLVMAALYNLVLFFGIRDRVYLIYIGYIVSALLLMGSVLGFGFYIWPLSWQLFLNQHVIFSNYAIAFFTVAFCTMFLRYHKDNCYLYKLSIAFLSLLLLLAILSFFMLEYHSSKIFFTMMVPLYLLCIAMIYKKLKSGFRWAKFYVMSWIPLIIGAAVQPLELTGFIPYSFATRHLFLVAILCEIVLMAMALADRVRYQREKALYHATHTQQTNLLNQAKLKQAYMSLTNTQRQTNLCLVKIGQFNSLMSILNPTQSSKIVITIAKALESHLAKQRQFINLELGLDTSPKVADLGGGIIAFISTKLQPITTLYDELATIVNLLPKQYQVSGLDLQLHYTISATEPVNQDGFDVWLQRGYLNLSHKHKPNGTQQPSVAMNLTLAAALQNAIRQDKLAIYLQPIINLKTGQATGAEALLRWPSADHNLNIEQLIQLAESTGIINELTLWVIDKACQNIALLNQAGFDQHTISVNLSAKNLSIHKLTEKIENTILKYSISAQQLKFELTEFALIKQPSEMTHFVNELNRLGSKVVLDDFGTGYSSLNYLVNYSFSTIKVDKSFIRDLTHNDTNQVIVKTAIDMAHNLGMNITIEGIEEQTTESLLIEMGADQAQGYFYSKAIPFEQYRHWLTSHSQ
ncbi:EAL domain-containing protein [Pseudoalteromonas mariniglutinosa]|uniref:EAL domain-containing protein n=1 Tax=Pseudoalteromonas mariniglutinosa TaxID=206042 RepID=UPI00384B0813